MSDSEHHNGHDQKKKRVALISMLASALLAVIKLLAAVFTGSLGMLSEAVHSLIDVGATIVTLFAIRFAARPADDEHHFGHAKIESVAALLEALLLIGTAIFIAFEATTRLFGQHQPLDLRWWAFAVLILSIAIDFNRSGVLKKTATQTSSDALHADAAHFESDMWSSLAVFLGLVGVWLGFLWADSLVALVVSIYLVKIAWGLGSSTLNTLLDAAPLGVAAAIQALAEKQDGVLAVKRLRIRPSGPTLFVDLDVNVPRLLNLTAIPDLKAKLNTSIRKEFPQADISITTNPVALDSETAFEKIAVIAHQRNHAIHHVTVQQIAGRMAVSFDLEVDGNSTLAKAHEQATQLEDAIRAGLGGDVEVESHIEPLPTRLLKGKSINGPQIKKLEELLRSLARTEKTMSDVHSIRVRSTDNGLFLHYHCRFAGDASVNEVHAVVDRIETKLQLKIKNISRVIAHAEPLGRARHKL